MTLLNKLDRLNRLWFVISGVMVLVIAALVTAVLALSTAHSSNDTATIAKNGVQGSCSFWHDLSQLELTPTSTKVAFQIIADARIAYSKQGCVATNGTLPPADSHVKPFLPTGVN